MSRAVFIDTNVLLDVFLNRIPFVENAQRIWSLAENRTLRGVISASSVLNVYYIVQKLASRQKADAAILGLQAVFDIEAIDKNIIANAIHIRGTDFEDAVQMACAARSKAICLITRDERHFTKSQIPVISPAAFLAQLPNP
jgi:predicted nucleic acid-binding protein